MKCLSLFSSVTIATCLAWNALTPLAVTGSETSYRYDGQPANRLRATTFPDATATLNENRVPWYEQQTEFRTPYQQSFNANGPSLGIDADGPSGDFPNEVTPFSYARQQRDAVVGEAEPLQQSSDVFDSMITQQADGYSFTKDSWDAKEGWGSGSLRKIGAGDAGCCLLWRAAVDFYYLKRTDTSPVTILVDDTTRAIEELNAQSLDLGYNPGVGLSLSRAIGCGACLNIGYFGLYDQQATDERTGDLALVLPGFATGGNPASYRADYKSELHSLEINIRQSLSDRFGLFAGVRYINLQEDFLLSSQIGAVVTLQHYDIDTDNNLFGFQFGTDVRLVRCGALQIDALVKCGFYMNDASQTTSSALIGTPVNASNDAFAVAGDAGVYATYCINSCLSVRAGYQVLGLHGLALAPEQLQQSNLATGTAGINTTGSALYGGATAGFQYAW